MLGVSPSQPALPALPQTPGALGNLRAGLLLVGKRHFLRMPLFGNAAFCLLRSFAEPQFVLGGVGRSPRD